VILRLYFLFLLKKNLLEFLVLGFRLLGASNSSICLNAEIGKFLNIYFFE
jgi:hypothetical protein